MSLADKMRAEAEKMLAEIRAKTAVRDAYLHAAAMAEDEQKVPVATNVPPGGVLLILTRNEANAVMDVLVERADGHAAKSPRLFTDRVEAKLRDLGVTDSKSIAFEGGEFLDFEEQEDGRYDPKLP